MSELTPCNYCSLQRYKRRAKERGNKIVVKPNTEHGGLDVFEILPNKTQMFHAWFMVLGDHCEC